MVSAAQIDSVDIHATVIGPVVGQSYKKLDASLLRSLHNFVETADVNDGSAVRIPSLKYDFSRTGPFSPILRQTIGIVCTVLIVKPPGTEYRKSSFLSGR